MWMINSRRMDYNRDKLWNYFFCDEHFEASEFMCPASKGTNMKRKKLMLQAVPTLFSVPNPPKQVSLKRRLPERFEMPSTKKSCGEFLVN